ncbi:SIMPL domain-containing protein [Aspergillus undulatus]|uniref:SIMPL domain-containing protein n=1 Tax=Aspergillus undulatus TaxID=1810928 RepID=UPI003CCDEFA0
MAPLSIAATGHGRATTKADRAVLQVTIEADGPDANAARDTVLAVRTRTEIVIRSNLTATEFPADSQETLVEEDIELDEMVSHRAPWEEPDSSRLVPDPQVSEALALQQPRYNNNNTIITDFCWGPVLSHTCPVYSGPGTIAAMHHTASVTSTIEFVDTVVLGRIAEELQDMDFVSIDRIDWGLTDGTKTRLTQEARRMASDNALEAAKQLAEAQGKKIAEPVKIMECEAQGSGPLVSRVYGKATGIYIDSDSDATRVGRFPAARLQPEELSGESRVMMEFVAA